MSKSRVVIVGGGFGGVYAARNLSRLGFTDIELISNRNYFVFQPLLPEVAAGTINPQDAVTPLRLLLPGVKVRLADVIGVDFHKRRVKYLQGRKRIIQDVSYDHLIIGSGQITDLSRMPGFTDHSLTMKDLSDAFRLRNQIIRCLELADVSPYKPLRRMALTFVVAGGGFSGVETMGELVEMVERARKLYSGIDAHEIRFVLVQRGQRLLPELPPKLGQFALENLQKRGVEVLLGHCLEKATASAVFTDDGQRIETMTLVTTIGNGPSAFIHDLDLPTQKGKLMVDRELRVQGQSRVWALGDIAAVPLDDSGETFAPPTAQYAIRQAKQLALNIQALDNDEQPRPFHYKPRGMLASLGNYSGVASLFGIKLTGLMAWLVWRSFYISLLPGISTRFRVSMDWFFDYFMPRNTVFMDQGETPSCRYRDYAAGEEVFHAGHLLDGFYTVVKGRLQMCGERPDGSTFEKTIGPGDHWGEWILDHDGITTGTVTALEDTKVLVMNKQDFRVLKEALPGFAAYFKGLDRKRYSQEPL